MKVEIKSETETWLKSQVASGRFQSVEEAVDALAHGDRIALSALEMQDLSWARPYLDKADDDIAAGRTRPAVEVFDRLEKRFSGNS